MEDVLLDAARVHRKPEAIAPVAVGIDHDVEPVRVNTRGIATGELCRDRVGTRVEHPDADVQRIVVVENAYFAGIGWWCADLGIALGEIARRNGAAPGGLIELSVYVDCRRRASGAHDTNCSR